MRTLPEDLWLDYHAESDASDEWFLPDLRWTMRHRWQGGTEDLGLRRLLEFPEAVAPRARRLRHVDSQPRTPTHDPDWPDAA